MYECLSYKKDWHVHLNKLWGLEWIEQRWTYTFIFVWESKGAEQYKVFVTRVMLGMLPTRVSNRVCGGKSS